jgi:hypothetical protein
LAGYVVSFAPTRPTINALPKWRGRVVQLIIYYLIFMVACDLAAYLIGLITERELGSYASLIVFLTLYFLGFWISWVLAVRVTEPKTPPDGRQVGVMRH